MSRIIKSVEVGDYGTLTGTLGTTTFDIFRTRIGGWAADWCMFKFTLTAGAFGTTLIARVAGVFADTTGNDSEDITQLYLSGMNPASGDSEATDGIPLTIITDDGTTGRYFNAYAEWGSGNGTGVPGPLPEYLRLRLSVSGTYSTATFKIGYDLFSMG